LGLEMMVARTDDRRSTKTRRCFRFIPMLVNTDVMARPRYDSKKIS
jgi:hypothetical protein